ncbi:hypothetical protein B9Z55_002920 [Caenorhabditis nigoni]|uniref:Uncharacterized protein n=1 Tax=Caenorhabditis nigoni TaxID=1611254 RepID=A0A2G5VN51_9PELO|nr:hypothetical protein B9Z55_002920 [Caenorhabditis nigoni]
MTMHIKWISVLFFFFLIPLQSTQKLKDSENKLRKETSGKGLKCMSVENSDRRKNIFSEQKNGNFSNQSKWCEVGNNGCPMERCNRSDEWKRIWIMYWNIDFFSFGKRIRLKFEDARKSKCRA